MDPVQSHQLSTESSTGDDEDTQYVYFVQAKQMGLIKIGFTSHWPSRLSTLNSQCPDVLITLGLVPTKCGRTLERKVKAKFAKHRSGGEWYRPDFAILDYIGDHAQPYLGQDLSCATDWVGIQSALNLLYGRDVGPVYDLYPWAKSL